MTTRKGKKREKLPEGTNRMPADSTFYNKILPILLIILVAFTILLILAAAAILLGVVPTN